MLRFQHIGYLWILLVIPVMVIVFFVYKRWQKKHRAKLAEAHLQRDIAGSISNKKITWKFILFCLSVFFLIIAISNPQMGDKTEEVKTKGVDIMVALDVSNSMKAQDIKPSRLERSKMILQQLINTLHGDRIGIVVFAGQAFVQLPLTSDYAAAKLFLPTIDPGIVPVQGTNFSDAINLCTSSFPKDDKSGKAIIIISDGENHDKGALSAAEDAEKAGINIYAIGMGTMQGGPIPIYKNGVQTGYMKDSSGNSVVTKLNPQSLQQIAQAADGSFALANNQHAALGFILNKIAKLKTAAHKTQVYKSYQSRFQIFIALSILFLILELIISTKRAAWVDKIQLFKGNKDA